MTDWLKRPKASFDENVAHCLALLEHSQPWSVLVYGTPRRYGLRGWFEAFLWNHRRHETGSRPACIADLLTRLPEGCVTPYERSCLEALLALESL